MQLAFAVMQQPTTNDTLLTQEMKEYDRVYVVKQIKQK